MKKYLALVLALVMCVAMFAGCGSKTTTTAPGGNGGTTGTTAGPGGNADLSGTYDIKVWVAEAIVDLTKQQIADFNANNGMGITINATVEPVGEDQAANSMTTDVEAGADLYGFASDQFARLIQAGALSKLSSAAANFVTTNNEPGSVEAVTAGESIYAYPWTSDNGYFMYYDKSVISEDDLGSLEALIAACEAAGKNFSFELENSWYIVSFFFATGCLSEWKTDDDGKFIDVNDNFNSEIGEIAAEGLKKLVTSPNYINSSATSDFAATVPSAIVVSGTWNYENAKGLLGDNLGVAELPSFEVGGESYHLSTFRGYKLLGVKPQSDAKRAAAINQLAQYLTGEQAQLERCESNGWGPSNKAALESDLVKNAPQLTALWNQYEYSRPQGNIHGSWWDIAKVIATSLKEGMAIETALANYQTSMEALFTMSDDVLNAWTVIGAIGGTSWDTDLHMTQQEDGTWKSDEAYEIADGVEFKVRQGKSWTNNYGMNDDGTPASNGANVTLAKLGVEAGTYYIVFDPATGLISVVAA